MGNHEYCELCGENDFHRGEPCNPEKKAKHQAERAAQRERHVQTVARATAWLKAQGVRFDPPVEGYRSSFQLSAYDIVDMLDKRAP